MSIVHLSKAIQLHFNYTTNYCKIQPEHLYFSIKEKPSTPQFRDVDGIFIQSACFQLIFQHTLNFLLHILLVRFREMGSHNIRCISDFLDKGRTVLCICCIVHTFFLLKSPARITAFCVGNGIVQPAQKDFENYPCRAKCYCLLFLIIVGCFGCSKG